MKIEVYFPEDPRKLDVPEKEKHERPENDPLQDGYERSECSYNWEDQRRKGRRAYR